MHYGQRKLFIAQTGHTNDDQMNDTKKIRIRGTNFTQFDQNDVFIFLFACNDISLIPHRRSVNPAIFLVAVNGFP